MARKLILSDTILRRYVSGVTTGPQTPLAGGLGAPMGGGAAFWRFAQRIGKFMSNLTTVDEQKII